MRLLHCLLMATACVLDAHADDDPRPPTAAELRDAKVYETIGEFVVRRDKLLEKFAVVMHGEVVGLGRDVGPRIFPRVSVRIVDRSRSFDLRAGYAVHLNDRSPFEAGDVMIQVGTKQKAIEFNPFVDPVVVKPAGMKLSAWQGRYSVAGGADPYDDYLTGATTFYCVNHGAIENVVLADYKLVRTETGLANKLISHWTYNPIKIIDWRVTMEFDPAYEMMPTRVHIKNLAIENDFQDTRITWRKHKNTLLPYRVELANGNMTNPNATGQATYRCYWLVGDEVPDKVFESDDHLGTLLDIFEIPRTRKIDDQVVPLQHEYPKDLFEDEDRGDARGTASPRR